MFDNAAPQGNYAASTNPASTAEKLYALENDPNTEGFNTWNITNVDPTTGLYNFGLNLGLYL